MSDDRGMKGTPLGGQRCSRWGLLLALLSTLVVAPTFAGKAAPWIVGYGADAEPGTTPCVVTNLSPDVGTANSLPWCLNQGNVTITFQTCGNIKATSNTNRTWTVQDGVYVAGNTCPDDGGGIIVEGVTLDMDGTSGNWSDGVQDVILQGFTHLMGGTALRLRYGTSGLHNGNNPSLWPRQHSLEDWGIKDVVFAHLALLWGGDKTLSIRQASQNVSLLYNIIASGASSMGCGNAPGSNNGCAALGANSGNWDDIGNLPQCKNSSNQTCLWNQEDCTCDIGPRAGEKCYTWSECRTPDRTWHGNIIANFDRRMPKLVAEANLDFTNNVIYNFWTQSGPWGASDKAADRDGDSVSWGNIIGNWWMEAKDNGATCENMSTSPIRLCRNSSNFEASWHAGISGSRSQLYFSDNYGPWCGADATTAGTCASQSDPDFDSAWKNESSSVYYQTNCRTSGCADNTYADSFNTWLVPTGSGSLYCQGEPYDDCLGRGGTRTLCCGYINNLDAMHKATTPFPRPTFAQYTPLSVTANKTLIVDNQYAGPTDRTLHALLTKEFDDINNDTGSQHRGFVWGVCDDDGVDFDYSCYRDGRLSECARLCETNADCVGDPRGSTCYNVCTLRTSGALDTFATPRLCSAANLTVGGGGVCVASNRTCIGPVNSAAQNTVPTIAVGTPWADTDSDGMDDAWEDQIAPFCNATDHTDMNNTTSCTYGEWTGPAIHLYAWHDYRLEDEDPPLPQPGEDQGSVISGGTISEGVIQ